MKITDSYTLHSHRAQVWPLIHYLASLLHTLKRPGRNGAPDASDAPRGLSRSFDW